MRVGIWGKGTTPEASANKSSIGKRTSHGSFGCIGFFVDQNMHYEASVSIASREPLLYETKMIQCQCRACCITSGHVIFVRSCAHVPASRPDTYCKDCGTKVLALQHTGRRLRPCSEIFGMIRWFLKAEVSQGCQGENGIRFMSLGEHQGH